MEARRLKKAVMIGCALVATGLAAQNAEADDTDWILDPPTVGDWFEPANWDNGVPTYSYWVYITNGGEARIAADNAEAFYLYLGYGAGASGALTQTGGTYTVGECLFLGAFSGGEGTYELSGTGSLSASYEYIGVGGRGTFTQTGGTNTVRERLRLGYHSGSEGTYELSGTGSLSAGGESIGHYGTGTFTHTGGTHTSVSLYLGYSSGSEGTYELSGTGSLSADCEYIGAGGTGTFTQTGGSHMIGDRLYLGYLHGGEGTYELSGTGSLSAKNEYIGRFSTGTGTFTQTGGSHAVTSTLYLGRYSGSNGTYTMSEGNLSAADFIVGSDGRGTLNITDSAANITVSNLLRFGGDSTLTAAPGATIHMTGSAFENQSTDPAALAGLGNLELIFEGGAADWDPFEVGGEDRGRSWDGFQENFALGGLTLGGVDIGQVRLVDHFDNQPAWEGSEALYVEDLSLGAGSLLDLNGLNLYYLRLKDLGGTVETDGGHLTQIPLDVDVDVKPGSCPNPLNVRSRGVLPVAILGTEEFDVMTIDLASILLGREGIEDGLAPLRWAYEDVATPFEGDPGDCHDLDGDGYLDLALKFETQDLIELLGLGDEGGGLTPLILTGSQTDEGGGYAIEGTDSVWVLVPGKANRDGTTPEPATLGLVAAGLVAVWMRKRRVTG